MNTTVDTDGEPIDTALGEDRLPWLESAEDSYSDGPSAGRVFGLILAGLLVIAVAVFGYGYLRKPHLDRGPDDKGGELIEAQSGDYKVKPDAPGGMKVEGEGDTVFATSEGGPSSNGSVDVSAVPEAPVAGRHAAPPPPPAKATSKVVAAIPPAGPKLTAQAPTAGLPRAAGGGGALVQLGSFPSEAAANAAWESTSKRFAYLAPLGKSVEKADVKGATVYRLRVNAGSNGQATTICGKLKVAGEACFVPS